MWWCLLVISSSAYCVPIDSFSWTGKELLRYNIGHSTYACSAANLVEFNWPKVVVNNECPNDQIFYGGFQ